MRSASAGSVSAPVRSRSPRATAGSEKPNTGPLPQFGEHSHEHRGARKSLVVLERAHHALTVVIVIDVPKAISRERNTSRADRDGRSQPTKGRMGNDGIGCCNRCRASRDSPRSTRRALSLDRNSHRVWPRAQRRGLQQSRREMGHRDPADRDEVRATHALSEVPYAQP